MVLTYLQEIVRNQYLAQCSTTSEARHLFDIVVLGVQTFQLVQFAYLCGKLLYIVLGNVQLLEH